MKYRLTNRKFSREWRRNKSYSLNELRWLARRKGLDCKERGGVVRVLDKAGKLVAGFAREKAVVVEEKPSLRAAAFATLVVGKTILLLLLLATQALAGEVISAYCHCKKCCGAALGITADGSRVRPGIIAAPRNVPFGTRVVVEGVGAFVVRDRTALRYDGRWDIYMPTHWSAVQFGKKEKNVYVLK
jgi:3D (Asp-Asp-Asp) domain-containing protein